MRVIPVGGAAPGLVAAVCDGHGGTRYVRSEVGSRLGVEVACAVGKRALEELGPTAAEAAVRSMLAGRVAPAIVERWRERVLDDVQRRAFTDDERARAGAPLDDDPFISYGCTLLLAIVGPSWIGLLQIGDGDVTVVHGSRAESPVPDDDRLVGGETTSLCLPTAVADARVSVLSEPLPDLLLLTSDGYANSFASPTWRSDAGLDLRSHVDRAGLDEVEARLPSWLAESATAGGDDVSMALIRRVGATGAAPVAAPAPDARTAVAGRTWPEPSAAVAESRPRRSRAAVAGGVAAATIIGLGVGWAFGRSGGDRDVESVVTEPAVSTTLATLPPIDTSLPDIAITVPTTEIPVATVAPGNAIELAPEHQLLLVSGDEVGFVIGVDTSNPDSAPPVLVARVSLPNRNAPLSGGWRFDSGVLHFGDCSYPAAAVLQQPTYVWSVDALGTALTWYDPATGAALRTAPLTDDAVTMPPPPQGCEVEVDAIPSATSNSPRTAPDTVTAPPASDPGDDADAVTTTTVPAITIITSTTIATPATTTTTTP